MWGFAFVDDGEVRGKRVKEEEDEKMAVAAGDIALSCFGLEVNKHKQQQKKKKKRLVQQDISGDEVSVLKRERERERESRTNWATLKYDNNAVVLWTENQGPKPKQQAKFLRQTFQLQKSKWRTKKSKLNAPKFNLSKFVDAIKDENILKK
jgi:hypothetical protein